MKTKKRKEEAGGFVPPEQRTKDFDMMKLMFLILLSKIKK